MADPTKKKERDTKRLEDLKKYAEDSIISGKILNKKKWDLWCSRIKRRAKKYPYSVDFTNDVIFEKMTSGCFYCGGIATTIDRNDSTLDHTPGNCVASCLECNISKGSSDSATFVRKAYYRARREYIDDTTDIWFVYANKPSMWDYKRAADKKKVSFDLTKEDFDELIKRDCDYCRRPPDTWFGIDRVIPHDGYVLGNVVTCCFDCNLDKHVTDVDTMMERNGQIARRIDTKVLVIEDCLKTILRQGVHKNSKRMCAYGKVYASKREATRSLRKEESYGSIDEIFEITEDFYDFAITNKLENITKKMYVLFCRM
jgi:5-methylcytosine-specific restriction endonuclease McrA